MMDRGIKVFVKREDLIHPLFGGNKWRKLKYNLVAFKNGDYKTLVTFGGPFSNHIFATAQICKIYNIKCTGIIRGEYMDPNNPTLNAAKEAGMQLYFVPKSEYKLKENSELINQLISKLERPLVIPEGGANDLASKGVEELMKELDEESHYDYIFVSAGTGMTASGIIQFSNPLTKVMVVNALKNEGLEDSIISFLTDERTNWEVLSTYHFGGFAKASDELIQFHHTFFDKYKIQLDPIYNAKTVYGLLDCIENGTIRDHSKVLFIHTGGLQGITAFEYRSGKNWLPA